MVPIDDVAETNPDITITLTAHDDASGDARDEVKLQISESDTSLANLMATYFEDLE